MKRVTRRRFLDHSAGSLLAAGVFAVDAGRIQARSSIARIGVGLIGTGGRVNSFYDHIKRQEDVEVRAVCDVDSRRLSKAAGTCQEKFGRAPKRCDDFRELLKLPAVDVVFIATPHHWHGPIAIAAVLAGKDVYVEKPASHVFREGRLILEAARKHSRIVQHGTQMRSSAVTAEARKVLDSGLLGEIKMSKAWNVQRHSHRRKVPNSPVPEGVNYDMWLGPATKRPFNTNRFHGNWQWYREYGNGDIGNDGIHDLDLARLGLGVTTHPVRITAYGSRIDLEGEREYPDNMIVAFHYAEGKVLLYEDRGWTPYGMHGVDSGNAFYGTEGMMIFSRRGYFRTYLGRERKAGPHIRGDTGMQRHIDHFFDCVRNRKQSTASAEVAHLSCALAHLGETAYRAGRILHFDPQTETIKNDREANRLLTKTYRRPWTLPEEIS